MVYVTLQKNVSIQKQLNKVYTAVWACKYKEMADQLKNEEIVTFEYVFGQAKKRQKQIAEMGFVKVETIFYNTHADYAKIKEVYKRGL